MLECGVSRTGRLINCVVLSETPPGRGLGTAAIEAARESRVSRRTLEHAKPGAKVRFALRFPLQDEPSLSPAAPSAAIPLSDIRP